MRQIAFTAPRRVEILEAPDPPLGPTEIRLRTLWSGISHGTELNFYRGTAPHVAYEIDGGLFRPRSEAAQPYPIVHGYECVGEVIEIGAEVTDFKLGSIAWTGSPHADRIVCDTSVAGRPFFCEPMPEGADPEAGIFLALAGVALDGHLTARLALGEAVLVSGLGVIGLFCVQLAARAGAGPIIAVDPIQARRDLALRFGADEAWDPAGGMIAERARDLNGGRGLDAAVETSGQWRALHEAIRCCASGFGRVVGLGFYQGGGADLRLGEEFHHSSFYPMGAGEILAIRHRAEPAPGRAWDRLRVYRTCARMLADGRLRTEGLLTRTFPFERAAEAFELIDRHPEQAIKLALKF